MLEPAAPIERRTTDWFQAWPLGRLRELTLLALAAAVGIAAGLVVAAMGEITAELHAVLFGIDINERLSSQAALGHPGLIAVPAVGGAMVGISVLLARLRGVTTPVDPIEANALHGGRMSIRQSLLVAVQTMISSGFGASVGLEAGYTQAASSLASRLAVAMGLRRSEVRMLVGCGAAGAISAAFNTPIAGAFYAFELIIGTYSVALVAPVLAAALAASMTASWVGVVHDAIDIGPVAPIPGGDLLPYLLIGVLGGLAAVGTMRLVALIEFAFKWTGCPQVVRPILGGAVVGLFGYVSPQVLSSGHGALHLELALAVSGGALVFLFCLKTVAAALSLGSGFRGGLFFSSLFLGSLLGKAFAAATAALGIFPAVSPMVAAVVGMAAMAVGAVGGPLTMTFLALESTGSLEISGAVLVASIVSALVVRETFGYSFSTWRLHLRGETIRSAHDVGRMRNLTVASMMRTNPKSIATDVLLQRFREAFPLGSGQRVIALSPEGRYAGILIIADVHAAAVQQPEAAAERTVGDLVAFDSVMLVPSMTAEEAAAVFRSAQAEELAVVDSRASRRVLGLLTEQHLLRRYSEELEKARKDLAGGT